LSTRKSIIIFIILTVMRYYEYRLNSYWMKWCNCKFKQNFCRYLLLLYFLYFTVNRKLIKIIIDIFSYKICIYIFLNCLKLSHFTLQIPVCRIKKSCQKRTGSISLLVMELIVYSAFYIYQTIEYVFSVFFFLSKVRCKYLNWFQRYYIINVYVLMKTVDQKV